MKHLYSSIALLCLCLLMACKTKQKVLTVPESEFEFLDTMVITAPREITPDDASVPLYHASYSLKHDLVHTKLDVSFDWEKEHVIGIAELTLKPFFYPSSQLKLDAKNFDIRKISLKGNNKDLKYEYDGLILMIQLDKTYTRKEEYTLVIDYTAKPSEGPTLGSDAITSDQGLFFINSSGEEYDKPQQIWTQGETEHNSKWFPTIDKPNERCTQEMLITVEDKFKTLSNGLLIKSTPNADGSRTDYWKMDQPHAPYLFMIAVGEFAVVKDSWNDIVVDYYVEPEYEAHAKDIFSNTPEMMTFFSEKLNVPYPWAKYSQVIVRDYVSGAMENTTGVIFGEFVQKDDRELIDNHNERIIAHELFHHWFGDLVTCESWSNLTLNEGFANYSEYLWFEHKYGADEADYHMMGEQSGYLNSAQQFMHPLIYFGYEDKEDMFDAHSYNKGGMVLHMLRHYIGEEAFWAGLTKYLNDHQYSAVEAHDLRLAFEDVTGQDLNWFFNQWYFQAGHPVLEIDYDYEPGKKQVLVEIRQTQEGKGVPAVFELPMAIDIYTSTTKPTRHDIRMTDRQQQFTFDVDEVPQWVNVDAEKMLLCEKTDNKTSDEFRFQFYNGKNFIERYEAISKLTSDTPLLLAALDDPFWAIRGEALDNIKLDDQDVLDKIATLAQKDANSKIRASAIKRLAETADIKYIDIAKKAITTEKPYGVISAALDMVRNLDPKEAFSLAQKMEGETNSNLVNAVGSIYAESGDSKYLSYFEKKWNNVDGYDAIDFFESYTGLFINSDQATIDESIGKLKSVGTNMGQSPWRRIAATKSLSEAKSYFSQGAKNTGKEEYTNLVEQIGKVLDVIKATETNEEILGIYQQFN